MKIQFKVLYQELTDLVETAVLLEFDRITERGGVLGAMETMYQRSKFRKRVCIMKLKHYRGIPNHRCKYVLEFKGSPTVIPAEVNSRY
jgi:methylmalonyl-CoA mutase